MNLKNVLRSVVTALMPGKARSSSSLTPKGTNPRKTIVVRTANDNACEMCANAAGPHEWDDPDCWVTHPNCQCSWDYEDAANMSVLNAKKRNTIDDEDFAGPNRTFPIPDQSHADNAASRVESISNSALKARIKSRIRAICKRKGLKVPPSCDTADHSTLDGFDGDVCSVLAFAELLPESAIDALAEDIDDDDLPPVECFDVPAEFARRGGKGNERVLLGYWAKQMPKEVGGSDYDDCVNKLTGKKGIKDAHALCNWLHQKSRGAAPGHAPGEKAGGHARHNAWADIAGIASFAEGDRVERDGFAVYPRALVWRAGEYPDKAYEMDREDNLIAATNFARPVPINIEHTPFLQGRAGELRTLYVDDDDPDVLRGEVAIPLWLDTQLDPAERQLSVGWERATKMPGHLGLTTTPRVMGAALFNAAQEAAMNDLATFAPRGMGHNTAHGQMAMQDIHDTSVRHGAVCAPPANMASRHEANATQQAHDLAAQHGAKCDGMSAGNRPVFSTGTQSQEGKRMSLKDKMVALFGGNVSPEEEQEIERLVNPKPANFSVESDPAFKAMQDEVRAERTKRITAEASAFADSLIGGGRATTAEREALIAKFSRAATEDYTQGTANFSGYGDAHSRVDELVAMEMARPADKPKAAVAGTSRVLGAHQSDPATFSGETQLSADEERKAQAERMRATDAYKKVNSLN